MRILVTGANGLVGSRLCAQLAAAKHEVTGLSRGARRIPGQGDFDFISGDLTDAEAVRAAVARIRPGAIIHTASMTSVDGCESKREGAFADNVLAAKNVALAARGCDAHVVHVSTDYVFDGDHGPYTEEDRPNPRGVYAVTKAMGEEVVKLFAPSWAIARTAVVYGYPPGPQNNFGAWLAGTLGKGDRIKLFEDQFVSPSLASNVAAMLSELAEKRETGIWNICGADVVDRVTFGQRLCAVFGFDPSLITPVKMRELNLPSPRPLKSGLVADKALSRLGAKPLTLDVALKAFQAEYRAQHGERAQP